MDFYTRLNPEVEKFVSVQAEEFSDNKRKLALFEKRQADTRALLIRLQDQKRELTDLADGSLAEDVNSFEKFKVSLKKINSEIESASEALLVLSDIIIPDQREKVPESARKLQTKLLEFWKEHQRACEKEMKGLLDQIVRLQDDFVYAFTKTADNYRLDGSVFLGMVEIFGSIVPRPSHPRFGTITTEGPPEAPKEQTLAEGNLIPSEAGPQATEPQTPLAEAAGTKPGTTLLTGETA